LERGKVSGGGGVGGWPSVREGRQGVWVPCAKSSGGARFQRTISGGGSISMGEDPLQRDFAEGRGQWWLAERARRGGGVSLGPPRKTEWWGSV
jgi:hypothetical protein